MMDLGCEMLAGAILNRAILDYEVTALEIASMQTEKQKNIEKIIDLRHRRVKTYAKSGIKAYEYTPEKAEEVFRKELEEKKNELRKIEKFMEDGYIINHLDLDREYIIEKMKSIAKASVMRKYGIVCDFL